MDLLPLDMFSGFKIQEQAPNLILVDALMGNFVDFLINANVFQKLPKDIQTIFVETGKEVELKTAEVEVKKWTEKIGKEFKSQNVKVYKFPDADRTKWAIWLKISRPSGPMKSPSRAIPAGRSSRDTSRPAPTWDTNGQENGE